MTDQPLVSIIVPSFNQGQFIRGCIDSILAQNYRPIEILVIDGGSTDETLEILQSYNTIDEVEWVSEPDKGPADAVNKGLLRANGAILAVQSTDDMYEPGAISKAVAAFSSDGAIGLVYGDICKADEKDRVIYESSAIAHGDLAAMLSKKMWIPQASAFFTREALEAVGLWDLNLPYTPDVDFWIRVFFNFKVEKIDDVIATIRMHGEQRDNQGWKIVRDWNKMIAKSSDVRDAPWNIRRAAKVGCHRNALQYNVGGNLATSYHLIMETIYSPESFPRLAARWRQAVPGLLPLYRFFKRRRSGTR